jgi:hypothetical protein
MRASHPVALASLTKEQMIVAARRAKSGESSRPAGRPKNVVREGGSAIQK